MSTALREETAYVVFHRRNGKKSWNCGCFTSSSSCANAHNFTMVLYLLLPHNRAYKLFPQLCALRAVLHSVRRRGFISGLGKNGHAPSHCFLAAKRRCLPSPASVIHLRRWGLGEYFPKWPQYMILVDNLNYNYMFSNKYDTKIC